MRLDRIEHADFPLWAWNLNHAEAALSFPYTQKLDPTCAMCYWGEALVLGPNINAPMPNSAMPQAFAAVRRALVLRENATGKERVLTNGLSKRFGILWLCP